MFRQALITATPWGSLRTPQTADGRIHLAPAAGQREPASIGKSLLRARL